jgi:hypothetical protein
MYTSLFPRFKVVEINRSTALTAGHVIAQYPAKAADVAHKEVKGYDDLGAEKTIKVLENGIIVGLNSDAEVVNYAASACAQPCLLANDELPTSPLEGLDQYCEVFENDVTYPRVLPLYVGDSFTTNNYKGTETDAKYAKVSGGVLELQSAADADTLFVAKVATLPAGQKAYHFVYVGKVAA